MVYSSRRSTALRFRFTDKKIIQILKDANAGLRFAVFVVVFSVIATTAGNARCEKDDFISPWLWAGVGIIGLNAGLAYANAQAVAHDDAGVGKGVFGITIGAVTTVMGGAALINSDEPWQWAVSAVFLAAGITCSVMGGRAVKSTHRREDGVGSSGGMRLVPRISLAHDPGVGLEIQSSF